MDTRYVRCLGGALAARGGDEATGPALLLAALAATGPAGGGPALLAGLTASAALGGPLVGVLLDRARRPGRLLAAALALHAAGVVLVLASLDRTPLAVGVLLAAGAGLCGPALAGGWTAQLLHCASPEALPRAHAHDAMTFDAAGLAGPALVGVVAAWAGAPAAVVAAAALVALAAPVAWSLPAPRRPPVVSRSTPGADLASGLRALRTSSSLARATATTTLSCAGEGILAACAPLLALRAFGDEGHGPFLAAGAAAAALAANALAVNVPAGRRALRPDALLPRCALVLAAALLLAATGHPVAVAVAVALSGGAAGLQLTSLLAVRHREAPPHLRAQVSATGAGLKVTAFALGAALAGPLAARSLPGALAVAALFPLLAAACALRSATGSLPPTGPRRPSAGCVRSAAATTAGRRAGRDRGSAT